MRPVALAVSLLLCLSASAEEPPPGSPQTIDWKRASQMATTRLKVAELPKRPTLQQVELPVLAPALPGVHWSAVSHANWYSLTGQMKGATLMVHGTRLFHQPPPGAKMPAPRPTGPAHYHLSRTHGIVDISFRAFGAAYTLSIECDAPLDDPRCTEDDFARAAMASVKRVLTGPQR